MHFIFGGRSQGKLQYAKRVYGENLTVCDFKDYDIEDALSADIIINIQYAVKKVLNSGENPSEYFESIIDKLSGKILIGDEIGCGVVPIDDFERKWRDETGWVYQFLALHAKEVIRVWAGIGQILKGEN